MESRVTTLLREYSEGLWGRGMLVCELTHEIELLLNEIPEEFRTEVRENIADGPVEMCTSSGYIWTAGKRNY